MNIKDNMSEQQARLLNPLVLAYIGDAVYELYIRTSLVESEVGNPRKLHSHAIKYVSARGQSCAVTDLLVLLDETEQGIYHRGRNSKNATMPKNAGILEYRRATGLEAVLGYLYLIGNTDRLNMLLEACRYNVDKG